MTAGQAIIELDTIPALAPEATDAKNAYTDAARETAMVAAMFVFFGLLVSFGLPNRERDDVDASSVEDPVGAAD